MAGKKIVVVDDSEVILVNVSAALEGAGYQVRTASSWEDLDRLLKEFSPQLVFLDVNMPEITGDNAVGFFREERGLQQVPILLFSDIEPAQLDRRSRDGGADGFVSKSEGVEGVVRAAARFLGDNG